MKKAFGTNEVIEELIVAICGEEASSRQQHVLRESLHALVRLARSEQILEMKANVKKLTGKITAPSARRRAKAALLAHRLAGMSTPRQQQFEFNEG
ncbi:hypothetical protein [Noviherbaspirillum massiliense]|uniref:hypothetical protein n=1 Tax=Noviherbaspirillum massiliense TaxID=1465823 RepID=UPI00030F547F|nr:hypothetical protein [Noviherbaspirillum massiliense]